MKSFFSKFKFAVLFGVLLSVTALSSAAAQVIPQVPNGSFEEGSTPWNGIPEVQVPLQWELSWAEDDVWGRPTTYVRYAPGSFLTRDGRSYFAAETVGRPMFLRMRQPIQDVVDPGEIYTLVLPIFPELLDRPSPGKVYESNPAALAVQLRLYSGGVQIFDSGLLDGTSVAVGRWSRLEVNFEPKGTDVEIHLEVRALDPANALNAFYFDGIELKSTGLISPTRQAELANASEYTVQSGDNLIAIANKVQVDLAELMYFNRMTSSSLIYPGMILKIPREYDQEAELAADEASQQESLIPEIIDGEDRESTPADGEGTAEEVSAPAEEAGPIYHEVKGGEFLARIASRYGVSYLDIMAANGITNPNFIYPGQVLLIPSN